MATMTRHINHFMVVGDIGNRVKVMDINTIIFFAVIAPARYSDEVKIPLVEGSWLNTPIPAPETNFASSTGV